MKIRKTNRLLALFISLCMVVGMLPLTGMTFAAELCPNHAAHDDTCGFVQAVEGHECGHAHDDTCGYAEGMGDAPCKHEQGEHDESCGYAPPSEEAPCEHTHDESCGDPDENGEYPGCTHTHDGGCGYAPAGEGAPCAHQEHDKDCGYGETEEDAPCKHKHDADCGYIEAVEGKPCDHICELCERGEIADVLPLTEEPPATYSISGLVDHALQFLPNISVTLWQGDQRVGEVNTDIKGIYSFISLAPGEYTVKAGGDRAGNGVYYIEQRKTVTITDKNKSCDFSLEAGNAPGTYSISGSVQDHAYHFLPGISVTLWQGDQQVGGVSTGAPFGNYSFISLAPGEYTVKAGGWSGGVYYVEQSQTVTITDSDKSCSFSLEPGNAPGTYTVSGKVEGRSSEPGSFPAPIPNVPVELWQNGERIRSTVTAMSGGIFPEAKFSFLSIPPGSYTLRVPAGTYGGAYQLEYQETFVVENSDVNLRTIMLKAGTAPDGYAVSGKIQNAIGGGLQGVPVQLLNTNVKMFETTTGADGSFSFPKVSDAAYTLKIPAGIYAGTAYQEANKDITVNGENLSVGVTTLSAATAPGAPRNFTAYAGIGQIALSWEAPSSNGGAEITKYQVSKDDGRSWTDASSATGHTFTNLYPGQSYTFQVRAVNSVGAGEAASTTSTPTAPGPSVPQNFDYTYANTVVNMYWKAPASDGGSAIVKYQYSVTEVGAPDDWKDIPGGASVTQYTVTGLTNFVAYTAKLRAVNHNGGVGEAVSRTFTPEPSSPSVPRNLTATPGDGQMLLTWDPPGK